MYLNELLSRRALAAEIISDSVARHQDELTVTRGEIVEVSKSLHGFNLKLNLYHAGLPIQSARSNPAFPSGRVLDAFFSAREARKDARDI